MDPGDGALASRVLEAIRQPVFATDRHGTVVAANVAAVRMTRRARRDLLGANVSTALRAPRHADRHDLDDRALFGELIAPVLGAAGVADLDLIAPSAHSSAVTASVVAMTSGEGDDGWVFTVRPRATASRSAAGDQRARLFDLSLDLMASIDPDGSFVDANPAWSVLGYDDDELFSNGYLQVVHEDDRRRVEDEVNALQRDKPFTLDFTCRMRQRDGGVRWYQWMAVYDPYSDTVSGVGHDISHAVHGTQRHQQQIRRLREREKELIVELHQAERAAEHKVELINQVSHEMRTPLTSVIGFAGLLSENPGHNLTDQNLTYLERIHRNGLYVLGLIEDVLDRTGIDVASDLEAEPLDLAAVVAEAMVQSEGAAAAKGLSLVSDIPEGLEPVVASRRPLVQVLINLIGNAVKYTDTGFVLIRVGESPASFPARIDVIDRGPGITAGEEESIFAAFRRGTRAQAQPVGAGLGLSIARTMARDMGFDLVVDSAPGNGSTFSVLLTPDAAHPVHLLGPSSVD